MPCANAVLDDFICAANHLFMKFFTTLFCLSLVFSVSILFAQTNLVRSTITLKDGSSQNGLIDWQNPRITPETITYFKSSNDQGTELSPTDLKEFTVNNLRYVTSTVDIETSPYKVESLENTSELNLEPREVFLEQIVSGEKNLFQFVRKDGRYLFYYESQGEFNFLMHKIYTKKQQVGMNMSNTVVENQKYKGQLIIYLLDCPKIQSFVQDLEYTTKSMTRLFESYSKCNGGQVEKIVKQGKPTSRIAVFAGLSSTALNFSGGEYQSHSNADFGRSNDLTFGFSLDVVSAKNNGKWSINNELAYTSFFLNYSLREGSGVDDYTLTYFEIGFSYLKLNNMFRYNIYNDPWSLFINAGISNGFVLGEKNYKYQFTKFYNQESSNTGKAIEDTRSHELGLQFGLGASYNRFFAELRYEVGNGVIVDIKSSSASNRLYLQAGYRF